MVRELLESEYSFVHNLCDYNFSVDNPYHCIIGYFEDNEMIAFMDYSIIYEKSELNYIFVKETYRNRGIASILLEKWFMECQKNMVDSMTLEVNENNIAAIQLYQKYGFKEVALRYHYYGEENALLMLREGI